MSIPGLNIGKNILSNAPIETVGANTIQSSETSVLKKYFYSTKGISPSIFSHYQKEARAKIFQKIKKLLNEKNMAPELIAGTPEAGWLNTIIETTGIDRNKVMTSFDLPYPDLLSFEELCDLAVALEASPTALLEMKTPFTLGLMSEVDPFRLLIEEKLKLERSQKTLNTRQEVLENKEQQLQDRAAVINLAQATLAEKGVEGTTIELLLDRLQVFRRDTTKKSSNSRVKNDFYPSENDYQRWLVLTYGKDEAETYKKWRLAARAVALKRYVDENSLLGVYESIPEPNYSSEAFLPDESFYNWLMASYGEAEANDFSYWKKEDRRIAWEKYLDSKMKK